MHSCYKEATCTATGVKDFVVRFNLSQISKKTCDMFGRQHYTECLAIAATVSYKFAIESS